MENEKHFGLGYLAGLSADLLIGLRRAGGHRPWPDVPIIITGRDPRECHLTLLSEHVCVQETCQDKSK